MRPGGQKSVFPDYLPLQVTFWLTAHMFLVRRTHLAHYYIVSSRDRPDAGNTYKTRYMGYLTPTPSPCNYGVMKTLPPRFQRWWCLQTPWVWGYISPVRFPPRSCG